MRKGIIYLLMSIFLLFTVENKQTLDLQQDFGGQNISSHLLSFAKKHRLEHSWEKASLQQINDSLDSPEENDINFPGSLNMVAIIASFGLGYLFHLYFKRNKQIFHEQNIVLHSVKKFILLRTIRI